MTPETAQWLTPDPPVKAPDPKFMADPWALHPYQYVQQNPILYWDPDGNNEDIIHGAGSYYLGLAAGLSPKESAAIAFSDVGVDYHLRTRPVTESGGADWGNYWAGRTRDSHFSGKVALNRFLHEMRRGTEPDLKKIGVLLHGIQDALGGPHSDGLALSHRGGHPLTINEDWSVGHPLTSRNDHAFRNPKRTREQMELTFVLLSAVAQRLHPGSQPNREQANTIIDEVATIDTWDKELDFLKTRIGDQPSYYDWLEQPDERDAFGTAAQGRKHHSTIPDAPGQFEADPVTGDD
jgi:hypothetical protein